jgi:hypothetical protein
MEKLYCYVDESGKETKGKIFVVAVVVTGGERDELADICEQLETVSEKHKDKWGEAKHERRMRYIRYILADDRFKGMLRYSIFRKTTDYDTSTVEAIANAIQFKKTSERYAAAVYVDGLSKTKRRQYAVELRRHGIRIRKVMGVARDESNALTRLADAIAGFISDALADEKSEIGELFERAKSEGALVEG